MAMELFPTKETRSNEFYRKVATVLGASALFLSGCGEKADGFKLYNFFGVEGYNGNFILLSNTQEDLPKGPNLIFNKYAQSVELCHRGTRYVYQLPRFGDEAHSNIDPYYSEPNSPQCGRGDGPILELKRKLQEMEKLPGQEARYGVGFCLDLPKDPSLALDEYVSTRKSIEIVGKNNYFDSTYTKRVSLEDSVPYVTYEQETCEKFFEKFGQ